MWLLLPATSHSGGRMSEQQMTVTDLGSTVETRRWLELAVVLFFATLQLLAYSSSSVLSVRKQNIPSDAEAAVSEAVSHFLLGEEECD